MKRNQVIIIIRACLVIVLIISVIIILFPPGGEPQCPRCLVANFGRLMGTTMALASSVGLFMTTRLPAAENL